jgi:hypothetical protein
MRKWPYSALEGGRIVVIYHNLDTLFRNEPFA